MKENCNTNNRFNSQMFKGQMVWKVVNSFYFCGKTLRRTDFNKRICLRVFCNTYWNFLWIIWMNKMGKRFQFKCCDIGRTKNASQPKWQTSPLGTMTENWCDSIYCYSCFFSRLAFNEMCFFYKCKQKILCISNWWTVSLNKCILHVSSPEMLSI